MGMLRSREPHPYVYPQICRVEGKSNTSRGPTGRRGILRYLTTAAGFFEIVGAESTARAVRLGFNVQKGRRRKSLIRANGGSDM
ncbi:unnamed protein product, partial [Brenthis ino]